jgi:uncharacterized protein YlxW (UPF0749 family)
MTAQEPRPRVDASMDLLTDIVRTPIDPDYTSTPGGSRRSRGWVVALVTLAGGLLVGASLAGTLRQAPQVQTERQDLLARVQAASGRGGELEAAIAGVEQENAELAAAGTGGDPSAAEESRLAVLAGTVAVRGPGVVVVVDDGTSDASGARVVDADLRQLVNQLWRSGAEAVSINGHRVTSRTAIRSAGDAVTVNYRSLTRPYRLEAIGDAAAMVADFPASAAGQWWGYLQQNFGVGFQLTTSDDLTLPADRGLAAGGARRAD